MNKPVLLLLFNRPKETSVLFDRLSQIKPKKIYINQDGPRQKNPEDLTLCEEVRRIALKPKWDCEVIAKISKKNLGCRESVSTGISWFFEKNTDGVILEDDCIPSKTFFEFSQNMLEKYQNENDVFLISGSNFQKNKTFGDGDYYFSKYAHCWGWSTWKRSWKFFDEKFDFWNKWKSTNHWKHFHVSSLERKYWTRIFDKVRNKEIDSWAYIWLASVWYNNGKTITPNFNLIENIGFNENATHTISPNYFHENKIIEFNKPYKHPSKKQIDYEADKEVFKNHFNGKFNFWPWRFLYLSKIFLKSPRAFFLKLKKKLKYEKKIS